MSVLLGLQLCFKLWMVVDALQRHGIGNWWPWFIFFFPFGSWIYFFLDKWPELRAAPVRSPRRPSLEVLRYAYRESPSLENQVRLAAGLFDDGRHEEARELYERTVARAPEFARAHYGLGLTAMAREDPATAADCFREVIALERGYADWAVWLHLAEAQRAGGDATGAVATLRELARAQPRLQHAVALAEALQAHDDPDEARAVLERALEDHAHAPGHVKRHARAAAKQAGQLLRALG